jgi:hypothetical protein
VPLPLGTAQPQSRAGWAVSPHRQMQSPPRRLSKSHLRADLPDIPVRYNQIAVGLAALRDGTTTCCDSITNSGADVVPRQLVVSNKSITWKCPFLILTTFHRHDTKLSCAHTHV